MPTKVHYAYIKYYYNTQKKEQATESVGPYLKHVEYEMRVHRDTPAPLEGAKNNKIQNSKLQV